MCDAVYTRPSSVRPLTELGAPVDVTQDELLACTRAILRSGETLTTGDGARDTWHESYVSLHRSLCLEIAHDC